MSTTPLVTKPSTIKLKKMLSQSPALSSPTKKRAGDQPAPSPAKRRATSSPAKTSTSSSAKDNDGGDKDNDGSGKDNDGGDKNDDGDKDNDGDDKDNDNGSDKEINNRDKTGGSGDADDNSDNSDSGSTVVTATQHEDEDDDEGQPITKKAASKQKRKRGDDDEGDDEDGDSGKDGTDKDDGKDGNDNNDGDDDEEVMIIRDEDIDEGEIPAALRFMISAKDWKSYTSVAGAFKVIDAAMMQLQQRTSYAALDGIADSVSALFVKKLKKTLSGDVAGYIAKEIQKASETSQVVDGGVINVFEHLVKTTVNEILNNQPMKMKQHKKLDYSPAASTRSFKKARVSLSSTSSKRRASERGAPTKNHDADDLSKNKIIKKLTAIQNVKTYNNNFFCIDGIKNDGVRRKHGGAMVTAKGLRRLLAAEPWKAIIEHGPSLFILNPNNPKIIKLVKQIHKELSKKDVVLSLWERMFWLQQPASYEHFSKEDAAFIKSYFAGRQSRSQKHQYLKNKLVQFKSETGYNFNFDLDIGFPKVPEANVPWMPTDEDLLQDMTTRSIRDPSRFYFVFDATPTSFVEKNLQYIFKETSRDIFRGLYVETSLEELIDSIDNKEKDQARKAWTKFKEQMTTSMFPEGETESPQPPQYAEMEKKWFKLERICEGTDNPMNRPTANPDPWNRLKVL